MSDANVDALRSPHSDQLGHLNIIMMINHHMVVNMMMMVIMQMMTMMVMMIRVVTMMTMGTHSIEESEAGVRQVVDQDHLHQGLGLGPGPGSCFALPSSEKKHILFDKSNKRWELPSCSGD